VRDVLVEGLGIGAVLGYEYYWGEANNVDRLQILSLLARTGYLIGVAPSLGLEPTLSAGYGYFALNSAPSPAAAAEREFRTSTALQPEIRVGLTVHAAPASGWGVRFSPEYRVIIEEEELFSAVLLSAGIRYDIRRRPEETIRSVPPPSPRMPSPSPPPRTPQQPQRGPPPPVSEGPVVGSPSQAEPGQAEAKVTPEQPPTAAAPQRPREETFFVVGRVFFGPQSTAVGGEAARQLDAFVERIGEGRIVGIDVRGHVADIGDPSVDMELSRARAEEVRRYLITAHGLDPRVIAAEGRGSTEPIAENATPEGRARNRRAEVVAELIRTLPSEEAAPAEESSVGPEEGPTVAPGDGDTVSAGDGAAVRPVGAETPATQGGGSE
jgi:outer membrane protein OmpA-like peptidoglycan-associated protein